MLRAARLAAPPASPPASPAAFPHPPLRTEEPGEPGAPVVPALVSALPPSRSISAALAAPRLAFRRRPLRLLAWQGLLSWRFFVGNS
jgi:hypothetical protein